MTLQTQLVDIKFDQGVDTRDDGFLKTGNFEEMSNVEIQKAGGIVKRNGFETVLTSGVTGTILKIHEINNSLVCVTTDGIFRKTDSSWVKVGNGPSMNVDNYSQVIPSDQIPVGIGESNGKTVIVAFKYFQTILGRGDCYKVYAHILSSDFNSISSTNQIIVQGIFPDTTLINGEFYIEGAEVHQASNGRLVLVCNSANYGIHAVSIYGNSVESYKKVRNASDESDVLKSSCIDGNNVFIFTSYYNYSTSRLRYYIEKLGIGAGSITMLASDDKLKGTGILSINNELVGVSSSVNGSFLALVDGISGTTASFTIAAITGGYNVKSNGVAGQCTISVAGSSYVGVDCTMALPIVADRVLVGLTWYDRIFANGARIYYKPANQIRAETINYSSPAGTVLIGVSFPYWNTGTVTISITGQSVIGLNIFSFSGWVSTDLSGGYTTSGSWAEPYPSSPIKVRSYIHSTLTLLMFYSMDNKSTKMLQYGLNTGTMYPARTIMQAVICSQITASFDAIFYDPSSLSHVQMNLASGKLISVHNQGNAKEVDLASRYSSADASKISCLISQSSSVIAPVSSSDTFFGPYNVIKQSAITTQSLMTMQETSSVFFTGGFLGEFSLNESSEVGFIQTPRIVDTYLYSVGGGLGAGDYQYAFTYSYVSSSGEKTESRPVFSQMLTTTGAGTSAIATNVSPLTISIRDLTKCFLNVYRTKKGESIFYKVTSIQMGGTDNIYFYDSFTDAYLDGKESIYTTGGILPNSAIGACFSVCATKNRVFVASSENKTKIYFSKEKLTGYGFEFNGLQYIDCNGGQYEGEVTSIFGMDEKVIIAKDRFLLGIAGDGPNAAGGGSDFSIPQLISTDVGVYDKNSVIMLPTGMMFKSQKGIYSLSRGLEVSYIGILVDKYAQSTVYCSGMHPKKNLVFFGLSGKILVYDYLLGVWFTWKGTLSTVDAISTCFINGEVYALNSNGLILKQNASFVDQYASPNYFENIITEIETSWLEVGMVNGFQRLRRIMLLGKSFGSSSFDIKIMRDYDMTALETHTLVITEVSGQKIQANTHVANQKSSTVKINIKESGTGTPNKISLSGMTFEIGAKKGTAKVPSSRKI
jgi:hypothetical protein